METASCSDKTEAPELRARCSSSRAARSSWIGRCSLSASARASPATRATSSLGWPAARRHRASFTRAPTRTLWAVGFPESPAQSPNRAHISTARRCDAVAASKSPRSPSIQPMTPCECAVRSWSPSAATRASNPRRAKAIASSNSPCALKMAARFVTKAATWGCADPRASSAMAMARSYNGRAATYSPWSARARARLFKHTATLGWRGPSARSRIDNARSKRGRAAADSPRARKTKPSPLTAAASSA
mmetsp:Transcript_6569/g.27610  ORF Transcript_6569/g.27610 Transcript_6569/m.27610 type:complete len:247 (+) Transcript_6569:2743-3483(+)